MPTPVVDHRPDSQNIQQKLKEHRRKGIEQFQRCQATVPKTSGKQFTGLIRANKVSEDAQAVRNTPEKQLQRRRAKQFNMPEKCATPVQKMPGNSSKMPATARKCRE
ncbi:hypothetical protein AVEN_195000-1 [Araneus ventricosus]|uniref:Uncharacterized protein n=1 Tax=Araneus ventricosus TaxID=182803 RepID=A0A4Y2HPD0_ARAVE|nr:hypothetical protein AVEN_195000-1 [Araneus ventricosus]